MREEENLPKDVMRMRNLLEQKLWPFDLSFILYFIYLTLFSKPQWCAARSQYMTDDCQMDIYGNGYYLLEPVPLVQRGVFVLPTLIMCYFNAKYYGIHRNLRKNVELLSSTRRTKLVLITLLNLMHFLFYFAQRDGIVALDVCLVIKVVFLMVVM